MYYESTVIEKNQSFSVAKVFGWMFLALGITAASSVLFAYLLTIGTIPVDIFTYLMIGSSLLMFVITFVIHSRVMSNGKSLLPPFIIYSLCMGLTLSTFVLLVDTKIIALAFGATSFVFGVLALYGYLTKRDLNIMGAIAGSLIMGSLILILVNWLIGSETIGWVVSFVSFAAIMLFVAVDMWRVKKIADAGYGTTNLCLYCAFQLYIDFVYIFIRIVQFILRFTNDR